MAEEEDTREVLFPQWMGPDQHGLTIEQTGEGEIFVKEVKERSIAARTGRVHEGDQIVGATIYFENMSSEETAELLKTLNRHKVGLKLQHRAGEKSPCRSPVGTLTWEGRTRFGGSSPDIILSGDDEDYKRIYTKKIKPRLKSEDLAEGVDVRTERHSSTSSDGSTITTITRRITTYTVDVPAEQIDLSSPEFKIKVPRHETPGEAGSYSSHVTVGASGTSETRWTVGSLKTTEGAGEGDDQELRLKMPDFAMSGGETQGEFSVSGVTHQKDVSRDIQVPAAAFVSLPGGTKDLQFITVSRSSTGISGEMGKREVKIPEGSLDFQGPTYSGQSNREIQISGVNLSGPQVPPSDVSMITPEVQISAKTPGVEIKGPTIKGDAEMKMPKVSVSGTSAHKGGIGMTAPNITIKKVAISAPNEDMKGGVKVSSLDVKGRSSEEKEITVSTPKADMSGTTLKEDIKTKSADINVHDIDIKGSKSVIKLPSFGQKGAAVEGCSIEIKRPTGEGSKMTASYPDIDTRNLQTRATAETPNIDNKSCEGGIKIKMPSSVSEGPKIESPDANFSTADATVKGHRVDIKGPQLDIEGPDVKVKGPTIDMASISGPEISRPDVGFNVKGLKLKGDVDVSVPKVHGEIKGHKLDIEGPESGFRLPKFKMPSFGLEDTEIQGPEEEVSLPKAEADTKKTKVDIEASRLDVEGNIKGPNIKMPSSSGLDVNLPKLNIDI
ncbi:neuroblast differentiation-associated protein AHNAK-like, partial [Scleropages formosus]